MTDTKNPLPEIFTYGKDDDAAAKTNAKTDAVKTEEKSSADAPAAVKTVSYLFLSVLFFAGILIPIAILYYGFIPDELLKTLAGGALSYAESFFSDTLTYATVFSVSAKLSWSDLFFFALLLIAPCILFSKTYTGSLVLLRTMTASLACGIALYYCNTSDLILIVTSNVVSSLSYLLGAHFTVKYSDRLRDQTKRLPEKLKASFIYLVSITASLGAAVITKTILIIIANTIIK